MFPSKLIKVVDAVIGKPLVSFAPSPPAASKNISSGRIARILLIRPGGIGDAVLLIPSINALMVKFPDAAIDILAEKRNSAVFSLCRDINRVYHYDKPRELLAAIRGSYDIVIDTEQWHRLSAVVARLTRSPMSIGYATNEREKLFTHPVPYSHDDYEVTSFLNLIVPIGENHGNDLERPFLSVPDCCSKSSRPLLQTLGDLKIVSIFPGSSIRERKWGSDRFHQTARMLSDRGYGIVVVGGKGDMLAGGEVTRDLPNSLNLCGRLSLPETAAILKESALLITGDSGIMHIGYGLGIKILALFGPGREKKWAPKGRNCRVINKKLPCSPCTTFGYTPRCRKGRKCMEKISVEEVVAESLKLLEV